MKDTQRAIIAVERCSEISFSCFRKWCCFVALLVCSFVSGTLISSIVPVSVIDFASFFYFFKAIANLIRTTLTTESPILVLNGGLLHVSFLCLISKINYEGKGPQEPMIPLILLANMLGCSAFSVSFLSDLSGRESVSPLMVKKRRDSKSRASGAGGGFGKSANTAISYDDYMVFPALEQQVEASLIPSPPELQVAGALPVEVYDRLDKIYGFPNFNFQNTLQQEPTTSFNDFITLSSSDNSHPASMSSPLDLSALVTTTTGDKTQSATSIPPKMEAISKLPQFSQFRVLHVDPLVLAIDDFFTDDECDRYVAMSETPILEDSPYQTRSKTVGKDSQSKAQRTSTTWFHHYKNVPELMSKASRLLGLDGIDHWEEAQTVR